MELKLQKEIQQHKPFTSIEEEVHLNVARTAAMLEHRLLEVFKEFAITPTQYNALRILRGAGERGLYRNEIRDRLIAQVPDATRLLDRLVEMGFVVRVRDDNDRRHVNTRITTRGLELLERLDEPIAVVHRMHFHGMTHAELRTLIDLLERARAVCSLAATSGDDPMPCG